MNASTWTWTVAQLGCAVLLASCATPADARALPGCDAPEVQEAAREAAAASVKIPFTLSTFSEVASESKDMQRACRVRAKHAASGAAIWMRFTFTRQPVAKTKPDTPKEEELVVVFAPIE